MSDENAVKTSSIADLVRLSLEKYGLPAIMEWGDNYYPGLRDFLEMADREPPEPKPAKTPTKVSHLRLDWEQYVSAPGLLGVWIRQTGAVVNVSFAVWPEAWRGKDLICRAGAWALRSAKQPAVGCLDKYLWGPGHRRDRDGTVAQGLCYSQKLATETYDEILALLNAAKELAERTLTLEKQCP